MTPCEIAEALAKKLTVNEYLSLRALINTNPGLLSSALAITYTRKP